MGPQERRWVAGVYVGALALLSVVYFALPGMWGPEKIAGDGWDNYLQARSLFFDHDVEIGDDLKRCCAVFRHTPDPITGRTTANHPLGTSLAWLPFLAGSHGVALLLSLFHPAQEVEGYSQLYWVGTAWGTLVWGLLGLVFVYAFLRRHFLVGTSIVATAAIALCTPLPLYLVAHPSYSMPMDLCAAAAFVLVWDRGRGDMRARRFVVLGALAGLLALMREPYALFALLVGVELLHVVVRPGEGRARRLGEATLAGAVAVGAALLVFSLQLWTWRFGHATWFAPPLGRWVMEWTRPSLENLLNILFWSRNGLIPWHPVHALALLGLVLALRRAPVVAAAFWVALGTQLYISVVIIDLWGGWAFGHRRLMGCGVLFAYGLAHVVERTWSSHARAPRSAVVAALAACLVLNVVLTWRVATRSQRVAIAQDMRAVYGVAGIPGVDALWRTVGNPLSMPAVLYQRLRFGIPPERFDILAGDYRLYRWEYRGLPIRDTLSFPSKDTDRYVVTDGPGRVVLALPLWLMEDDLDMAVHVERSGSCAAPLMLRVNDRERATGTGCNVVLRARVPRREVRWGMNRVEVVGGQDEIGLRRVELASVR